MNLRTALGRLRVMGVCEGISWVFLLAAMFFKYGPGLSDETHAAGVTAVRIVGSIHGGLFVLYLLAVINAWVDRKWGFDRAYIAGLASFPPFGTFLLDGSLKREQMGMPIQRYSSWAIASVPQHIPWMYGLAIVLSIYKNAHGPVAGEVLLAPLFLFVCPGLLGGLFGVLGLVSIQRSGGRLLGRWLAWTGVGLTLLFPVSGLFWGDLIRVVQSK